MAIVLSPLTLYSGTNAEYMILPATFGMDTIQKGVAFVKDGIKDKHTISRANFTRPFQDRVPTPTTSGQFSIDGRELAPSSLMLYNEFDPAEFEVSYLAEIMTPTLLAREVPPTAEEYMMRIALEKAYEQLESGLWMASKTYTAIHGTDNNGQICYFDGFIKKMLNDSSVVQMASPLPLVSTASVTNVSTNILEAMDKLKTSVAINKKALISKTTRFKRMKYLMSIKSEQIYQDASVAITFKGQITQSGETQPWKGYQVIGIAGMPDDTIIFCEATDDTSSNLWVGLNSMEDNSIQLSKLQNNSEMFFIKALMKYDVNYGWSDQIFLYTTLTADLFNA